jgi:hypothetical protein
MLTKRDLLYTMCPAGHIFCKALLGRQAVQICVSGAGAMAGGCQGKEERGY